MAYQAYMTLTGDEQGAIQGSCQTRGHQNTVEIDAFKHDVNVPFDLLTGQPNGTRHHGPLVITKQYDTSSPKLYQALCSGEHLTNVTINWYRINNAGAEEHYFTTTLSDAIVVSIKPWMQNTLVRANQELGHMEDISLTYSQITWTYEPDHVTYTDNWRVVD